MAEVVDAKVKVSGADQAVKELNEVGDAAEQAGDKADAAFDSGSKGAKKMGKSFKGLRGGFKSAVTGLKAVKVAIAATGIGLLVQAVITLGQKLAGNEKIAKVLEKAMAGLGAVFNVIVEALTPLGEALGTLFTEPQKALDGFLEGASAVGDWFNSIWDFLKNTFLVGWTKLVMGIKKAQLAWNEFTGDDEDIKRLQGELQELEGDLESYREKAVEAAAEVVEPIAKAAEEFKKLAEESTNAYNAASALADKFINLRKAQRDLNLEMAKSRADIAEYRQISADVTQDIDTRIDALRKANEIEVGLAKDRENLILRELDLKRQEMDIQGATEERRTAINELQIALEQARLETTELQTGMLTEINGLYDEQKAKVQEVQDAEQERLDGLYERQGTLDEAISSAQDNEIMEVMQKYDTLFALAEEFGYGEQELQERMNAEMKAINDKYRKEEEDATKASEDKKLQLKHANIQAGFQLAQAGLQLLQALEKEVDEENEAEAKKQFQRGKKIQIAGAIMSTAQAVIAALAAPPVGLGFPAGLPGAITAGITGAAQIATIAKQKFPGGGGGDDAGAGGGGTTAPRAMTQALVPDNFAPGESSPIPTTDPDIKPPRAYVVSGDVTSSQQLDAELSHRATL